MSRSDLEPFERAFAHIRDGEELAQDDKRLRRFSRAQIVEHLDEVAVGWLEPSAGPASQYEYEGIEDTLLRMLTSLDWIAGELRAVMEATASASSIKFEGEKA